MVSFCKQEMDSRLIEVAKETAIIICRAAVCTSFWPTALGVCGTAYLLLFLPLPVSSVWPVGFLCYIPCVFLSSRWKTAWNSLFREKMMWNLIFFSSMKRMTTYGMEELRPSRARNLSKSWFVPLIGKKLNRLVFTDGILCAVAWQSLWSLWKCGCQRGIGGDSALWDQWSRERTVLCLTRE